MPARPPCPFPGGPRDDDALPLSTALALDGDLATLDLVSAELLRPDGRAAVTAVLTSGRSRSAGASYVAVPAPDVPDWQDCTPLDLPAELVPFGANVDVRPARGLPLSGGPVAELVAWVRLRGDDPLDSAALTVLADVMPPALYAVTTVPVPVPRRRRRGVDTGRSAARAVAPDPPRAGRPGARRVTAVLHAPDRIDPLAWRRGRSHGAPARRGGRRGGAGRRPGGARAGRGARVLAAGPGRRSRSPPVPATSSASPWAAAPASRSRPRSPCRL